MSRRKTVEERFILELSYYEMFHHLKTLIMRKAKSPLLTKYELQIGDSSSDPHVEHCCPGSGVRSEESLEVLGSIRSPAQPAGSKAGGTWQIWWHPGKYRTDSPSCDLLQRHQYELNVQTSACSLVCPKNLQTHTVIYKGGQKFLFAKFRFFSFFVRNSVYIF